jgi:hypothetical protein
MVTEAIFGFFVNLFDWLLGTLPEVQVPDWLNATSAAAGTVFGYAQSMGVWFPSGLALTVVGTLMGIWVVSFGIKVARMILSLFTAGGGSAA